MRLTNWPRCNMVWALEQARRQFESLIERRRDFEQAPVDHQGQKKALAEFQRLQPSKGPSRQRRNPRRSRQKSPASNSEGPLSPR